LELPAIEFNETPNEQESSLILFMANSGTLPLMGMIFPESNLSQSDAVGTALDQMRSNAAYQEMGALKDDTLLQVTKGSIKTNYGNSRKRECNFTLLNIKKLSRADYQTNINQILGVNGCYADFVVIDRANAIAY